MTNAITTVLAKKKLLQARAGDITLPIITSMAIGTGGVDADGNPIQPSELDTSLKNEIIRKPIESHSLVTDTEMKYSVTITYDECSDENINELALVDSDGDIVCIKTFKNKIKDSDVEMTFDVSDVF